MSLALWVMLAVVPFGRAEAFASTSTSTAASTAFPWYSLRVMGTYLETKPRFLGGAGPDDVFYGISVGAGRRWNWASVCADHGGECAYFATESNLTGDIVFGPTPLIVARIGADVGYDAVWFGLFVGGGIGASVGSTTGVLYEAHVRFEMFARLVVANGSASCTVGGGPCFTVASIGTDILLWWGRSSNSSAK